MSREDEIRTELFDHTLNGHAPEVKALTEEGLKLGMDPMDILFKALIPSLEEVGRRFEKGDFFVPEMLIAARAMQGALVILRPLIAETGAKPIGKVVIGTVKGDIHDIGKNLVIIMMEGAGFEVVDLGVNCPPEKFVEAVRVNEPHIVGFSAFLTTTMPMFKVNIQALEKAGLRNKVAVMVGGAPVTEEYAKLAGADHYSPDASIATRMAKQIVGAAHRATQAGRVQDALATHAAVPNCLLQRLLDGEHQPLDNAHRPTPFSASCRSARPPGPAPRSRRPVPPPRSAWPSGSRSRRPARSGQPRTAGRNPRSPAPRRP